MNTSSRSLRPHATPLPRYRFRPGGTPTGSNNNKETTPEPLSSDSEPIWVRREKERKMQEEATGDQFPWGLYLLLSSFVAIAAVGCIFEYVDKNPFFGIIQPDSPLWAPILLTLAITGFPTSGFLFYKGVDGFNQDADRQNKLDGY